MGNRSNHLKGLSDSSIEMKPGYGVSNKYFCMALFIGAISACLFRLIQLIEGYTIDVPFLDQYFIYRAFIHNPSWYELFFQQNGQHRQGIGSILQKIVLNASGWDNQAVSYLILAIIVLALMVAVLISRKLFHLPASPLDIALPLIFLTSNQYETLVSAGNVSPQALPLLLTIIAAGLFFIKPAAIRTPLLVFVSAIAIFTGYGYHLFFSLAAVTAIDLLRSFKKRNLPAAIHQFAILGFGGICLGLFFWHLRWYVSVDCFQFPHYPLYDYPLFIGLMPAKFFGFSYLRTPLLAMLFSVAWIVFAALLIIKLAAGIVQTDDPRWRSLLLLVLFTGSFATMTSIGRICSGMHAAGSPRYMTMVIPCAFAMYLLLRLIQNRTICNMLGSVFILFCLAGYLPPRLSQRSSLVKLSSMQAHWRSCYLKVQSISECDKQVGDRLCTSEAQQKEVLDYLQKNKLSLFRK
jgi:hypothetical protein